MPRKPTLLQHPSCPLPFEWSPVLPSGTADDECAQHQSILLPPQDFDDHWVSLFKNPNLAQAAKMALQAYQVREPFMVREVFSACLRVSDGVCPEAYNLLAAKTASNLQEARALYAKAEELCPRLCEDFEEVCQRGALWCSAPHLHSYMRALLGSANTLRKMGHYQEALDKYRLLGSVDGGVHDDYFPNYRYHVPQLMMALGDLDGAERFILVQCRQHHSSLLSNTSATLLPWVWGLTLLGYIRATEDKEAVLGYPSGPYHEGMYVENVLNNTIVFSALDCNPHVLPLLMCGAVQAPGPVYPNDASDRAQAIAYVHDSCSLWKQHPKAVEWMYRCQCTRGALRHLANNRSEEVASFEYFRECVSPAAGGDIFESSWQENLGLIQRGVCAQVFGELDLDGDGNISAVEMKLWFQKVISKFEPSMLPHHIQPLATHGQMPQWIEAVSLMDLDDDERITLGEFWRFWSMPKASVFLEESTVTSRSESFLRVLVQSYRATERHLKVVCGVMLQQGVCKYKELVLDVISSLVLHDDRPDLLQVFVSYHVELRGIVVRNLPQLFLCAAVQGSWQSMHLLLREFSSLRAPDNLLEGLRHVLRSKAYFTQSFHSRGSTIRFKTKGLAPLSVNHSWCKCVDALVTYGLGVWCLQEALMLLDDPSMKRLIRKLMKSDKHGTTQSTPASRDEPALSERHPILPGPSSPPPFEAWDSSCNPLRIAEQLYDQPVPPVEVKPQKEPRQWHRLHPLYVHLLHRFEEEESCIRQDVAEDLGRAAAELSMRIWVEQLQNCR